MNPRVGLIILAAGESSRFGFPKQLAAIEGQTLIQRAVNAAVASGCEPIAVVLGAMAEEIRPQIEGPVQVTINRNWADGMASSIQSGLKVIENEVDAVIITLCDQPLITFEVIKKFVAARDRELVAAEYAGGIGVPALFGRKYFSALHALDSQGGAKQILMRNKAEVTRIPCPEAAVDIDTAEDYQKLTARESGEVV